MNDWINITEVIYFIILTLVILTGIVRFRRLTIPVKILLLYVFVTLLGELFSNFFAIRYKNNMPVSHISAMTEFILNALIYYFLFRSRVLKGTILICIPAFITFFVINSIFFQSYKYVFPSNSLMISGMFYAVCSLLLFKQMLSYPTQVNITRQSIFWYNIGMLFYSSTIFLNWGLLNYFINHKLNPILLYKCSSIINLIFYVLLGISLLIDEKEIAQDNVWKKTSLY